MQVTDQDYKEALALMGRCDRAADAERAEARFTEVLMASTLFAADAEVEERGLSGDAAYSFRDGFLGVSIKQSNPRKTDTEPDYRDGKAARAKIDAQMRAEVRAQLIKNGEI